ncbi:hypothetical protein OK074_6605 [Actinobacteria bacterium OK074]|nr:hypothetical protein OK074_6605 [Actinobacteria bacterium OK074]
MPVTPPAAAVPTTRPAPAFRGRIGRDARSGHYAVPGRYRLHLSLSCSRCLRIAITHSLLGLDEACPVTVLPAVPDGPAGEHSALRPLYEASAHRYSGAATAPVLSEEWSGRIVSTHAPDILRDLARRFATAGPELYPCGAETEIRDIEQVCAQDIEENAQRAGCATTDAAEQAAALDRLIATLDSLERRLTHCEYLLGDQLTGADVELWVTLVQLDTVHRWHLAAAAVHRIAEHPALWAYARRLAALPAFGRHLDLDGIARRHHAHCQGLEAAGAAVQILDWAAHTAPRTPAAHG